MHGKNGITRRWFIGGACAAVAGVRYGALAGDLGSGKPLLKLGVLSDVHLNHPGDEEHFLKALAYFRDNGADGVLIAGDIADTGRVVQLERMADCWFRTFPNDKAPDGRHVERLFVYGNHDVEAWTWGGMKQYKDDAEKRRVALGFEDVRAKTWQRLFHEEFNPIWMKTVKGIRFVGAHWEGHCPKIEPFMAEHGKEFDPAYPFFYTQHSHPKDTCYGPAAWGHDPGYATRAFSPFPNAVALSGHSHYTLTDEHSVWQGAFTSIGTATLRRTSLDYLEAENSNGNPFDPAAKSWTHKRIMKPLYRENGKQGMLIDVYQDRLVIHRREFLFDQSLGDDWTVPIPSTADTAFAYAKRAQTRQAPKFAADATVKVTVGKTPPACARKEVKGPFVYVTFPAAKTVAKCRTFEYEVRAVDPDGKTLLSRRVMAPGFNLPESKCDMPGECLFTFSEFPNATSVRFEVRASECFGKQGPAITSGLVQLKAG
ncbi:MAG: metallophosphoesterase [Kiritimatiellae bacterium]|nr:metallophosphoesterase [Kiritimatiellia bacterium]